MEIKNRNEELISIIVPVYNTEKYLKQCMQSLVNQTYKNIEIIVINDGSTDQSQKILEKYLEKDSRVKIIFQENKGISAARNKALELASGRYIMFVDSDDWIELNTCQIVLRELMEHNSDIVMWPYKREYSNSSKDNYFMGMKTVEWRGKEIEDLWRRMIGPVGKELNPQSLYHYRKEDAKSFTHLYKKEKVFQWKELYSRIYKMLLEQGRTTIYYDALRNRICLGLIGLGLNLVEDERMTNVQKLKELRSILKIFYYRDALKQLEMKYFPFQWRIFFICAKYQLSVNLIVLLYIMNFMRKW